MNRINVRWTGDHPDFDTVEKFARQRGMAMGMGDGHSRLLRVLEQGASAAYSVHVFNGELIVEGATGRERPFAADFIRRYGGEIT